MMHDNRSWGTVEILLRLYFKARKITTNLPFENISYFRVAGEDSINRYK
jgi:hypothetical protein